jgi:hypothetical protein
MLMFWQIEALHLSDDPKLPGGNLVAYASRALVCRGKRLGLQPKSLAIVPSKESRNLMEHRGDSAPQCRCRKMATISPRSLGNLEAELRQTRRSCACRSLR